MIWIILERMTDLRFFQAILFLLWGLCCCKVSIDVVYPLLFLTGDQR
jgi:hypothetical protein